MIPVKLTKASVVAVIVAAAAGASRVIREADPPDAMPEEETP